MKKLLIAAAMVAGALSSFAQGQFLFTTYLVTPALPIYINSTTSGTVFGGTVEGTTSYVDYIYSQSANVSDASLLNLSLATPVAIKAAGTFSGSKQTIAGVKTGPISLEVRAWNGGSTYAAALQNPNAYTGTSAILQVTLGDPNASPTPGVATPASDWFKSFSVTKTPEPTTIALGVMGLSLLVFRRRK